MLKKTVHTHGIHYSPLTCNLVCSRVGLMEPAAVNRMEAGLGTVWAYAVGSSFFFRWLELFASFPMSLLKSLYQPCLHELDPKLRLVEAMSALFPKKLQKDWTKMIWPGFIAPTESYHLVPYSERVSKDSSVDGFQNGLGRGAASQRSWRLRFAVVYEIDLTWTKRNLLGRKLFECINSWKWLERRNFALPLVAKSWNLQLPWLSTSTRWTPYRWIRPSDTVFSTASTIYICSTASLHLPGPGWIWSQWSSVSWLHAGVFLFVVNFDPTEHHLYSLVSNPLSWGLAARAPMQKERHDLNNISINF